VSEGRKAAFAQRRPWLELYEQVSNAADRGDLDHASELLHGYLNDRHAAFLNSIEGIPIASAQEFHDLTAETIAASEAALEETRRLLNRRSRELSDAEIEKLRKLMLRELKAARALREGLRQT
jgi:hypothetical protein